MLAVKTTTFKADQQGGLLMRFCRTLRKIGLVSAGEKKHQLLLIKFFPSHRFKAPKNANVIRIDINRLKKKEDQINIQLTNNAHIKT